MSRQTAIQTTNANAIEMNSGANAAPTALGASGSASGARHEGWSYVPALDVIEYKHEYAIVCDAPGIVAEQIELTYDGGVLHLHAPVQARTPQNIRLLRQEYGVGDFDRSIPLGRIAEFVDGERITASYEAGVLTVKLPKLASAHGRKITVKTA